MHAQGEVMGVQRVLVAFANRAGSTAGIAEEIAIVLRRAGLDAECRLAGDVADVTPYGAVILGSGVFVPRRHSDGGGFLARHTAVLASRPVWLFCVGPIGGGRCSINAAGATDDGCNVSTVAKDTGARGSAMFGPIGMPEGSDPVDSLGTVDHQRVRGWAAEIAADLIAESRRVAVAPHRPRRAIHRCGPLTAAP
ncbi:MAG TPA: flavodoxin domain-containing protein [Candidatus Limnocylindrales bacterium]|nr:flavodoxin domain-containing protein [Candidatus Limnocylindrales bacterium]